MIEQRDEQGAFVRFCDLYATWYPSKVPTLEQFEASNRYPGWLSIATAGMFVSGALLSGVHTIPVVRTGILADSMFAAWVQDVIAMLAFIAVELAIFISAFMLTGNSKSRNARRLLIIAFLVALASNLSSVYEAIIVHSGDLNALSVFVTVMLGVGAPSIAYLAGEMFVHIVVDKRRSIEQSKQAFGQAVQSYESERMTAFKQWYKPSRRPASPVHVERETKSLPGQERSRLPAGKANRTPNATEIVEQYLEANRWIVSDPEWSVTRVMNALASEGHSISRGTVHAVLKRFRDQLVSAEESTH